MGIITEVVKGSRTIQTFTPEVPSLLVKAGLSLFTGCPGAAFPSLARRVKAVLKPENFDRLLAEREILSKVLTLYPVAALDLDTGIFYRMRGENKIAECGCIPHARNKTPIREILEKSLIEMIDTHFDALKTVSIMSLGSGGCFQELVIHAKIAAHSRKKINWTLVDPIYKSSGDKRIMAFDRLIKLLSPGSTVNHYDSELVALEELERGSIVPQVFLDIDTPLSETCIAIDEEEGTMVSALEGFVKVLHALKVPHIWATLIKGRFQVIFNA